MIRESWVLQRKQKYKRRLSHAFVIGEFPDIVFDYSLFYHLLWDSPGDRGLSSFNAVVVG